MRIVLDTNVLLVSIGSKSPYRPILNAILSGKISVLLSTEIYLEYLEKIEERTNALVAANIVKALLETETTELIIVHYRWHLIQADQDDNKFSDCAIAGNADYLVTEDSDFNVLKNTSFPTVRVINAKQLIELLETL